MSNSVRSTFVNIICHSKLFHTSLNPVSQNSLLCDLHMPDILLDWRFIILLWPLLTCCCCFVAPVWVHARYCDEFMSLCLSVRSRISKHVQTPRNFLYMLCSVLLWRQCNSYVLPVLWMTSSLFIIGEAKATPIEPILKVTHQGEALGAKSWRLQLPCWCCCCCC